MQDIILLCKKLLFCHEVNSNKDNVVPLFVELHIYVGVFCSGLLLHRQLLALKSTTQFYGVTFSVRQIYKRCSLSLHLFVEDKSSQSTDSSGSCGTVTYQVRRWSHGTYTLLHDTDLEQGHDCALDAVLHFNYDG